MVAKRRLAGWATALLILAAAPAFPQQVDIKTLPPGTLEPLPEVVPPGLHYEITRPDDADYYPEAPSVRHDPAFIEPFTAKTADGAGEFGLSGWTSPATPVGPGVVGLREVSGWLSFGLSISWGGPPAPAKPVRR